jgi:hypothetical protein
MAANTRLAASQFVVQGEEGKRAHLYALPGVAGRLGVIGNRLAMIDRTPLESWSVLGIGAS